MGKAKTETIDKWKKEHTKKVIFYINKDTEQDVLEHYEHQPNKRVYLIGLIRKDMERR